MLRLMQEKTELNFLSPYAAFSSKTLGRERQEEECSIRTCFQRDVDRITYSKSFRRLKHKTQVFLSPEGDHYRTRLTHTLEVARIARTIACALKLNEPLTEAIALGHDLGHTPFGHAGEEVLNGLVPGGFSHNSQSLRVVTRLEKGGVGLNLTKEVNNGILCHRGESEMPITLEGQVVRLSDKVAYINHDIDDAMRAGVLSEIPPEICSVLGNTHSERIDTLVKDIIENSLGKYCIYMSDEVRKGMLQLRSFLFEEVYKNPVAKGEESKARGIIEKLYNYYKKHPNEISADYLRNADEDGLERVVCDYVAGMTDRFAIARFSDIFIPKVWEKI